MESIRVCATGPLESDPQAKSAASISAPKIVEQNLLTELIRTKCDPEYKYSTFQSVTVL